MGKRCLPTLRRLSRSNAGLGIDGRATLNIGNMPTSRVFCAAIELWTSSSARLRGAEYEGATALWAGSGAWESVFKWVSVLSLCSPTFGQHAHLNCGSNLLHLLVGEHYCCMAFDIRRIATSQYVWGKGSLKFAFTPEHYNWKEFVVVDTEKVGQCLGMPVILMKRVLEFELFSENTLHPLRAFLVTKNPTVHVLGFNDEYTMPRNNDMVNLGGAIECWNSDIIQSKVYMRVQKCFIGESALNFPYPAFD